MKYEVLVEAREIEARSLVTRVEVDTESEAEVLIVARQLAQSSTTTWMDASDAEDRNHYRQLVIDDLTVECVME